MKMHVFIINKPIDYNVDHFWPTYGRVQAQMTCTSKG